MKEELKPVLLYIIISKFKEYKFMKIGKTKNLYMRVHNIKTGCPHEITNVFIMKSEFDEEVSGWEKLIHRMLKDHKLNREWYLCNEEFMEIFSNLIEMINSGDLLGDDYDFLDEVSFNEIEILLHSHNIKFASVQLPIEKSIPILESGIEANRILEVLTQ